MIARVLMFGGIATALAMTAPLVFVERLIISACLVLVWGGAYWTGLIHGQGEER